MKKMKTSEKEFVIQRNISETKAPVGKHRHRVGGEAMYVSLSKRKIGIGSQVWSWIQNYEKTEVLPQTL